MVFSAEAITERMRNAQTGKVLGSYGIFPETTCPCKEAVDMFTKVPTGDSIFGKSVCGTPKDNPLNIYTHVYQTMNPTQTSRGCECFAGNPEVTTLEISRTCPTNSACPERCVNKCKQEGDNAKCKYNTQREIDAACTDDTDQDCIGRTYDNCPVDYNPEQEDTGPGPDGKGDICDNCKKDYNPDQLDNDNDRYGNVCDNCKEVNNPDQANNDQDHLGNVCDNCKNIKNDDQANSDMDLPGNVCDNCINIKNDDQLDDDSDKVGNACDNCPNIKNPDQADSDADSLGDVCDNCPSIYNPGQEDINGNGIGDVCEISTNDAASIGPFTVTEYLAYLEDLENNKKDVYLEEFFPTEDYPPPLGEEEDDDNENTEPSLQPNLADLTDEEREKWERYLKGRYFDPDLTIDGTIPTTTATPAISSSPASTLSLGLAYQNTQINNFVGIFGILAILLIVFISWRSYKKS